MDEGYVEEDEGEGIVSGSSVSCSTEENNDEMGGAKDLTTPTTLISFPGVVSDGKRCPITTTPPKRSTGK